MLKATMVTFCVANAAMDLMPSGHYLLHKCYWFDIGRLESTRNHA